MVVSNQAFGSLQTDYIPVGPAATYHTSVWLRGEIDAEESAGKWVLRASFYDSSHAFLGESDVCQGSTTPSGGLTDQVDARGCATTLTYDAVGNVLTIEDHVAEGGPQVQAFGYCGASRSVAEWTTGWTG